MKISTQIISGYRDERFRCLLGCSALFFIAAVLLHFFAPELSGQTKVTQPRDEDDIAFGGRLLTVGLIALCAILSPLIFVRET
jgi:hypothetical protein